MFYLSRRISLPKNLVVAHVRCYTWMWNLNAASLKFIWLQSVLDSISFSSVFFHSWLNCESGAWGSTCPNISWKIEFMALIFYFCISSHVCTYIYSRKPLQLGCFIITFRISIRNLYKIIFISRIQSLYNSKFGLGIPLQLNFDTLSASYLNMLHM